MGKWQHLKAIIFLPVMVTLIIPTVLLLVTRDIHLGWFLSFPLSIIPTVAGCTLVGIGLFLLVKTNQLFAKIGKGTLAPWDPPKKLIVSGIYRNSRNPMILGVLIILLGEAVVFGSIFLFLWFILFLIGNHIYIIKSEEPNLIRRFKENYLLYMEHVPRWIPRLKPWNGLPCEDSEKENKNKSS
ncbi:MAG: isoprenylcysteine carboxylmethyltransferase family protein [Candidatus Lokiarchaeia archaeon]